MTDNLKIWNSLSKTDPGATKPFSRAGGFKGTSVKPMWIIKRLTEEFGPAGVGWGVYEPTFQVVHGEGEILVYCTVSAWHGKPDNRLWGVGGDKVLTKRSSGPFHDDEAFKKAYTDAVNNAFKSLGVAADIHMGLFDDDKYVASMEAEFAPPPARPATLSEDQRFEVMTLLEATGVPVGDYLAVGNWSDLREVPADQFELGKKWINKRAAKRAAEQKENA